MNAALARLNRAQQRTRSLISAGLEPAPDRLPPVFEPTIDGYESFLRMTIEATSGLVCAYKANLAFFEALGSDGAGLLERVRGLVPEDVLFIADAKRGDIGSSARMYAAALYDRLDADAATVNPLMGRDCAEAFLAHTDRLTFFLVLTSNPGASDFLMRDGLYRVIARRVVDEWGAGDRAGFVVGATRSEHVGEVRSIAKGTPFLVPGVGAQGGHLEQTVARGRATAGEGAGLIIHATRSLLPEQGSGGDPAAIIREKTERLREQIRRAMVKEQMELR